MNPEIDSPSPPTPPRSQIASVAAPFGASGPSRPFEAASKIFAPPKRGVWDRMVPQIIVSLLGGLGVSAGVYLLMQGEYICTARLGSGLADSVLAEAAARAVSAVTADMAPSDPPSLSAVSAKSLGNGRIELTIRGAGRQFAARSLQYSSAIADGIGKVLAGAAASPSEAESLLEQLAASFRQRLDEAQRQVSDIEIAQRDPRQSRDLLLVRWEGHVAAFDDDRRKLSQAVARVQNLQQQPEPTRGTIPAAQRDETMLADVALQQDLKELHVRLTETRLQLLNVWQATAEPLNELTRTMERTVLLREDKTGDSTPANIATALATLRMAGQEYAELLRVFAEQWNRHFVQLKQAIIDPLRSDVIDAHTQARQQLHDFLFKGAARLTTLREQVQVLSENPSERAIDLVRQSELVRGFHQLQTAHHRFEFASSVMEPRQNPRLDAALTGAKGLRRRSQQQIQTIDERLSVIALQQARQQHAQAIADAKSDTERLRTRLDQSIADLVRIQDELNVHAGMTEQFLRELLAAEIANTRLSIARQDMLSAEARLQQIRQGRTSLATDPGVVVLDVSAPKATNLGPRFRVAAMGGLLAMIALQACQSWARTHMHNRS